MSLVYGKTHHSAAADIQKTRSIRKRAESNKVMGIYFILKSGILDVQHC
jgi:hypothetical protein